MERYLVLTSVQRALLRMISTNMRAITVGYSESEITLRVFFESEPSELEGEMVSEIASEICADFEDIIEINEEMIVSNEKINSLEILDDWVFMRQE